ncbi:uncharacterized protein LOC110831417 [Zootermopsis nevadensis]|uniref:uncharacterized protein LOC110831417 n=1 Tax=Zootermopsis nevadensis TaxID=136037 RepID=UPI000B8EB969|nr:uncharacterized protein LOC110831417 [Zootermopsis nevadensis]
MKDLDIIIWLLQGPAPVIIAYKDKNLTWLKGIIEQVCTAVQPSCLYMTKVAWVLLIIVVMLFIFKILVPELKAFYHVMVLDIKEGLERVGWRPKKKNPLYKELNCINKLNMDEMKHLSQVLKERLLNERLANQHSEEELSVYKKLVEEQDEIIRDLTDIQQNVS